VIPTYSCQPIHPTRDWLSRQILTDIICKMVAILWNQMICVAIVLSCEIFNEWTELCPRHVSCAHPHRPSIDEARAAFWFHHKYPTCWELMCSKSVLHAMNCLFEQTLPISWIEKCKIPKSKWEMNLTTLPANRAVILETSKVQVLVYCR
jgi:hypothetical protein